jgi:hypothetical protein
MDRVSSAMLPSGRRGLQALLRSARTVGVTLEALEAAADLVFASGRAPAGPTIRGNPPGYQAAKQGNRWNTG